MKGLYEKRRKDMGKISKTRRIAMRELRRKISEKTAEKEAEAYYARSWHWEESLCSLQQRAG